MYKSGWLAGWLHVSLSSLVSCFSYFINPAKEKKKKLFSESLAVNCKNTPNSGWLRSFQCSGSAATLVIVSRPPARLVRRQDSYIHSSD